MRLELKLDQRQWGNKYQDIESAAAQPGKEQGSSIVWVIGDRVREISHFFSEAQHNDRRSTGEIFATARPLEFKRLSRHLGG